MSLPIRRKLPRRPLNGAQAFNWVGLKSRQRNWLLSIRTATAFLLEKMKVKPSNRASTQAAPRTSHSAASAKRNSIWVFLNGPHVGLKRTAKNYPDSVFGISTCQTREI